MVFPNFKLFGLFEVVGLLGVGFHDEVRGGLSTKKECVKSGVFFLWSKLQYEGACRRMLVCWFV